MKDVCFVIEILLFTGHFKKLHFCLSDVRWKGWGSRGASVGFVWREGDVQGSNTRPPQVSNAQVIYQTFESDKKLD